ncbi:ABC transporter permease subunit [Halorarius halobius]|uniref:ABC transporter permease subunit n=1 Tax=Halorarius halobius TaxID=2962671 RepID=UPI0020CE46B5|nr:ABC transporter permease subunit [Halorarius halobius]
MSTARRFALAGYESKGRLKGSLALSVGISLLGLMMVAFFPSVKASGADLQAYVDSLPPAFQQAFGIEAFTTMGGFLAAELYVFGWVLLLGLYFAYRAGGLIARDIERGRMDTLLATPLSRTDVVLQTFASLLVPVVVVNTVAFLAVYGGILAVGETIDVANLAMVHLLSVPYLLACAAIGLLLSVVFQRADLAERGGLGAVFALFLVETVAASTEFDELALLSPTHYYDPTAVLVHSEYDIVGAGILLLATAALVAASVLWFRRADVR